MQLSVARRYTLPVHPSAVVMGPVVRASLLQQLETSEQLLQATRKQCANLLNEAEARAQVIAFEARRDAQQQVWLSVLDEWERFCESRQQWQEAAHTMLQVVLRLALERLKVDTPGEERIRSSIRLVLQEWSGTQDSVLRLHPDDVHIANELLGHRPHCQVIADAQLAPGVCELHGESTLLRADFSASVDALAALFCPASASKENS